MAFTVAYFRNETGMPPGRATYRYDFTDHPDVVEAAGYFNNKDDDQNLAIGDRINYFQWSDTPWAAAATISRAMQLVVTNIIANNAAVSPGAVNVAQVFLTTGLLSSGT